MDDGSADPGSAENGEDMDDGPMAEKKKKNKMADEERRSKRKKTNEASSGGSHAHLPVGGRCCIQRARQRCEFEGWYLRRRG